MFIDCLTSSIHPVSSHLYLFIFSWLPFSLATNYRRVNADTRDISRTRVDSFVSLIHLISGAFTSLCTVTAKTFNIHETSFKSECCNSHRVSKPEEIYSTSWRKSKWQRKKKHIKQVNSNSDSSWVDKPGVVDMIIDGYLHLSIPVLVLLMVDPRIICARLLHKVSPDLRKNLVHPAQKEWPNFVSDSFIGLPRPMPGPDYQDFGSDFLPEPGTGYDDDYDYYPYIDWVTFKQEFITVQRPWMWWKYFFTPSNGRSAPSKVSLLFSARWGLWLHTNGLWQTGRFWRINVSRWLYHQIIPQEKLCMG